MAPVTPRVKASAKISFAEPALLGRFRALTFNIFPASTFGLKTNLPQKLCSGQSKVEIRKVAHIVFLPLLKNKGTGILFKGNFFSKIIFIFYYKVDNIPV